MADADRTPSHSVTLLEQLAQTPEAFDFYQAVRRLDCAHSESPQTGQSARVADDPVRFGQEASLAFAPSTLYAVEVEPEQPPRLIQRFFGLFGPQGPLPLHITEYVRERLRNHDDYTLLRFSDVFHHRMTSLFYRAWARVRPTISFDQPATDRFSDYVGSLFGIGSRSLKNVDAFSDLPKRHFAGLMSCQTKHADGLLAILSGYFRLPVQIEEFVGQWVELPSNCRCMLGMSSARLGVDTTVGSHVWDCQQKFRVVLGPLDIAYYYRMLPGGGQSTADTHSADERSSRDTNGAIQRTLLADALGQVVENAHTVAHVGSTSVSSQEASELFASQARSHLDCWPGVDDSLDDHSSVDASRLMSADSPPESISPRESEMKVRHAERPSASANSGNSGGPDATSYGPAARDPTTNRSQVGSHSSRDTSRSGASLDRLAAAVRSYAGDELEWDLKLILRKEDAPPLGLGIVGHLGWSTWLVRDPLPQNPDDLVLAVTQLPKNAEATEFRYIRNWSNKTLGQTRDGEFTLDTTAYEDLDSAIVEIAR